LAGRWLNTVRIDVRDWLWIIKMFEIDASASVIAVETGISYPTVLKAVDAIRRSIAASNGGAVAESNNGGIEPGVSVLGVLKDGNGSVRFEPVKKDSIFLCMRIDRGYLILLDRMLMYSILSIGGRATKVVDLGKNSPWCRVYCDRPGFWRFAKERLIKHHGISPGKLALYLREMEFRWINRNGSIFDLVTERLCRFMPGDDVRVDGTLVAV
jgi:transposase